MPETLAQLSKGALTDLAACSRHARRCGGRLIDAIVAAKKIVVFGCGREGLQMRGFAMRLFHMGRDVAVWGDMTTPPVGPGDLDRLRRPRLSRERACPPRHRTQSRRRTALVTAQPKGDLAGRSTSSLLFPPRRWRTTAGRLSVLPMGSLFETAQMISFELVVLKLRPRFDETPRRCALGTPISSDRPIRAPPFRACPSLPMGCIVNSPVLEISLRYVSNPYIPSHKAPIPTTIHWNLLLRARGGPSGLRASRRRSPSLT